MLARDRELKKRQPSRQPSDGGTALADFGGENRTVLGLRGTKHPRRGGIHTPPSPNRETTSAERRHRTHIRPGLPVPPWLQTDCITIDGAHGMPNHFALAIGKFYPHNVLI